MEVKEAETEGPECACELDPCPLFPGAKTMSWKSSSLGETARLSVETLVEPLADGTFDRDRRLLGVDLVLEEREPLSSPSSARDSSCEQRPSERLGGARLGGP